MTDTNTGSTIRFTNDEQRKVFQLKMALNVLESEVINTMGIRFYRGSIINVLRRTIHSKLPAADWPADRPADRPIPQMATFGSSSHVSGPKLTFRRNF